MSIPFLHNIVSAKPYEGQIVRYMQPKLDGHRITAIRQTVGSDRQMILYTRSQTDLFPDMVLKAQRKNIWQWISDLLKLPGNSSIDGELYVPGEKASYIKTAIKECDPRLSFNAFAVPWFQGKRCYTAPMMWAMDIASNYSITFIPFIDLNQETAIDTEHWLRHANPETEGWVAKRGHYFDWYKLKREKTIDLIVTGVTEGNGKYSGQVGALRCSAYDGKGKLVEVCTCSGMTDEERANINEDCLGKVCEVKYQEVLSQGRLRHPNFVRWRTDKLDVECNMGQEPELLKYWGGV